ncbi:MAG: DOMON domain-containing protein [Chitinophagales bacterium]
MKTFSLFLITLYGLMATIPANFNPVKQIEKNGMKICWQINGDKVDFEVFAPTKGWVAIGFNETSQLVGNNLIMGKVENGITVSDRYIVGFGDHQTVESMGGTNHLSNIEGKEDNSGTTIRFSINADSLDKYHYDLLKDKPFTLLIAYSQEDDFSHHSRMRTSIDIVL